MDTPKDAYEEAIEKMARIICYKSNDDCWCKDKGKPICEREGPLRIADYSARAAAEAIGLREMMEAATLIRRDPENPHHHPGWLTGKPNLLEAFGNSMKMSELIEYNRTNGRKD